MYVSRLEGEASGEIKAKLDMARKLKKRKMSISEIMELTGLTQEQVKQA